MPAKIQSRPVKEREKHFINLFVKEGAVQEKIADCARRASLTIPACRKLLKKKSVQADISLLMEVVKQEHFRQQVISAAAAVAKTQVQEELKSKVSSVQRMKIDLEVLDHELMTMAVGLDKNLFPKEKLDSIKAAYVVFGTLESGNTRRLIPPEHLQQNDGQGTYTSLFNRLALKSPSEPALEASPSASDEVFDLIPRPDASVPLKSPFPPMGEATAEPNPKSSPANVITVEVE